MIKCLFNVKYVLCFGFVGHSLRFFWPTAIMLVGNACFLAAFNPEYINTRLYNKNIHDDQVKFNRYICFEHQSKEETDAGFVLVMKNSGVRILVLADKYISRSVKSDLYCFHPYLGVPNIQVKKKELLSLLERINKCT